MEDMGESEDMQEQEPDLQSLGLAATTPAIFVQKTAWEQTILALQQLGIIVFVALLVGGGFMLMVGIELALGWAWDQVTGLLGTKKKEDPENPAALVGSFKRYK